MSDKYQLSGRQIAAARALIGMSQNELAQRASVSIATLRRMEASENDVSGLRNNVSAVHTALKQAGVIFIDENGDGPGVRLKK